MVSLNFSYGFYPVNLRRALAHKLFRIMWKCGAGEGVGARLCLNNSNNNHRSWRSLSTSNAESRHGLQFEEEWWKLAYIEQDKRRQLRQHSRHTRCAPERNAPVIEFRWIMKIFCIQSEWILRLDLVPAGAAFCAIRFYCVLQLMLAGIAHTDVPAFRKWYPIRNGISFAKNKTTLYGNGNLI